MNFIFNTNISSNKTYYEITSNEIGRCYQAKNIIKQESGCIFFNDIFDNEQIVCGNYSVTKY